MLVDFHMHTSCSDGVLSPDALFEEIRRRDLQAFCVSDHDNLDAYPMPPDLASRAIPGLEVDSHHEGHTAHLLAYGVDDAQSELLRVLREQRDARAERMREMVGRCQELGLSVTLEDVKRQAVGSASLGRPHLARALLERGHVASVQEAFDRYLADEGEGYVALRRLSSKDAIALIHAAGGVAVVAHPKRLASPQYLDDLLELGADGIEAIHPTASAEDAAAYTAVARERDLIITGGSDFHAPVAGRTIGVDIDAALVDGLRAAITRRALRAAQR